MTNSTGTGNAANEQSEARLTRNAQIDALALASEYTMCAIRSLTWADGPEQYLKEMYWAKCKLSEAEAIEHNGLSATQFDT